METTKEKVRPVIKTYTPEQIEAYRAIVAKADEDAKEIAKREAAERATLARQEAQRLQLVAQKRWRERQLRIQEQQKAAAESHARKRIEYKEWCKSSGVDKYIDCIYEDMKWLVQDEIERAFDARNY